MKQTHGGKRPNSGAKQKYNEPTKTMSFRVPISHIKPLNIIVKDYLDKLKKSQKTKDLN